MTLDSIRGIALVVGLGLALTACSPATVGEVLDAGVAQEGIECCATLALCCSEVLVNPIFIESCNQVARQGLRRPCAELLEGYRECESVFDDGGVDRRVCEVDEETTEER